MRDAAGEGRGRGIVLGVIRTGDSSRGLSVPLPLRAENTLARVALAGVIMALGAHAADGSIISARVSHSHACDQTCCLPPSRLAPPSVLTPRILETANPNSIVLQLLTASSRSRMKDSLLSNALTSVTRSVSLTAPISRRHSRS